MKITEQPSRYNDLEKWDTLSLVQAMNAEDETVAAAVKTQLNQISRLVDVIADKLLAGGKLYYIGAGSSGRIAVMDASEMEPTFGVPSYLVKAVIAGGNRAMTSPVEFAEDDESRGWTDLEEAGVDGSCVVIGISASGSAPYVLGALKQCRERGIVTASISCNPKAEISIHADHPLEIVTGPEFITGSTRLKAGTAQKMVLNMISTSVMIRLGRVEGNRMVNMQLTNQKLISRGTAMVAEFTGLSETRARELLLKKGSVKAAIESWRGEK